eukprot:CAMPEP_0185568274 /NCGR_PEP_ID=MMETSP0434-20130131/1283_1 /TAXON_ID=626734 ORGANISM="Favella taraikaensis, Strain Fe Narragansett Bay" /NCGR_SAMPLE_ID=MMETSP0434 /ASSEMBLY_ACC=CAM_ASM_000379 /LENGTH=97 /DNA_ID=CAMNT_0028182737 /DNA_START=2044 /DNA_END=2337 /DNA_ORIENTATION=+
MVRRDAHLRVVARVRSRQHVAVKEPREGVVRVHNRPVVFHDRNAFWERVKELEPAVETLLVRLVPNEVVLRQALRLVANRSVDEHLEERDQDQLVDV